MKIAPTAEQVRAIDAFTTHENMIVEAGAGTGKTTTLKLMAGATPERRGLYIAYNAAIARESAATFPDNVECRTAHSVAYRWTASKWGSAALRRRLSSPRMPTRETARILGSRDPVRVLSDLVLSPERVASLAMRTVQRWCYSGSPTIEAGHLPELPLVDTDEARAALAAVVVPLARRAWADLSRSDGALRFQHDHYLKLWALSDPRLSFDFVLVDEAQDSNGVVTGVVKQQQAQVVAVGDRNQSIYAWRGAIDAMDAFGSRHHVFLTQSFRFGPLIATEANKWLEVLESPLRLVGSADIASRIEKLPIARAVLCRTNAEAISTVMRCHKEGRKVALVGGGSEVVAFARAARDLMERGSTSHPELFVFVSWNQLVEYVQDSYDGGELSVLVRLIEEYGPEGVIDAVDGCVADERDAEVTVSTAHKAKGREWDTVRIADDFDQPDDDHSGGEAEWMLAYVAVTRARKVLDRTGLAWVDTFLAELRQVLAS